MCPVKVKYNPKLKELALKLRNNSTKSEIKLWQYLKNKQLMGYDFHRQKPIDNFMADFYCNKLRLAIELDGYTHGFEEAANKDKLKEKKLKELGISILRFYNEDVMRNIDSILRAIQCYIEDFEERHKTHTP